MLERNLLKIFAGIIFLILTLTFLALTFLVSNGQIDPLDLSILRSVRTTVSPALTFLMVAVSFFGNGVIPPILFFLFGLILLFRGYQREIYFLALIWVGPLLSWGLKTLIAKERPDVFLEGGYSLPANFSFPSGHVLFYVVFFGLVVFYAVVLPKINSIVRLLLVPVSTTLIFLIGYSRIYLGVHWPTDVLAGYLLGFSVLEVLIFGYLKSGSLQKVRNKQNKTDYDGKD